MRPPQRLLALLLALTSVLLPAGCAVNPATGRSEIVFITPEEEEEIGRKESERVDAEIGLFDDPQLLAYIEAVGRRMARHSPRAGVNYSFHILDMQEPNAFALPGGYIYVSRGMLAIANSEDELANVLGHEIAHVAARHAAQRQARATGAGLLGIGGVILGAIFGAPGELLSAPQLLASGLLAAYGRDQEREADDLGQEMAVSAGVDPRGMADFLRTLENTARLRHGASRLPSFFDTHPSTPERVASATTLGESLRWRAGPGIASERGDFLRRLDGLIVGHNPAEGVFRGGHFLHADLDLSLRFPSEWTMRNARSAVGAVSERSDASITLQHQGRCADPLKAARVFLEGLAKETSFRLVKSEPLTIAGLQAFHAHVVTGGEGGSASFDITWIAHGGLIYRVAGRAPGGPFRSYQGLFRKVARSFRPLDEAERNSIQVTRMRLLAAREGETLSEVSARSQNTWDLNETAVANAVFIDSVLEAGWLVKVAVDEPYHRKGSRAAVPAQ